VQCPLRNHYAPAGQQLVGPDHRQALAQQVLDLLVVCCQHRPALPVPAGAVRTDPLSDPADQLIAELPLTTGPIQPARLRGGHVTADGLAIQARQPLSRPNVNGPSPRSHNRSTSRISCT
jgi:hypothetical protein